MDRAEALPGGAAKNGRPVGVALPSPATGPLNRLGLNLKRASFRQRGSNEAVPFHCQNSQQSQDFFCGYTLSWEVWGGPGSKTIAPQLRSGPLPGKRDKSVTTKPATAAMTATGSRLCRERERLQRELSFRHALSMFPTLALFDHADRRGITVQSTAINCNQLHCNSSVRADGSLTATMAVPHHYRLPRRWCWLWRSAIQKSGRIRHGCHRPAPDRTIP
jgi:hypothetical protein